MSTVEEIASLREEARRVLPPRLLSTYLQFLDRLAADIAATPRAESHFMANLIAAGAINRDPAAAVRYMYRRLALRRDCPTALGNPAEIVVGKPVVATVRLCICRYTAAGAICAVDEGNDNTKRWDLHTLCNAPLQKIFTLCHGFIRKLLTFPRRPCKRQCCFTHAP